MASVEAMKDSLAPPSGKLTLIPPYGGELVNLLMPEVERASIVTYANQLPSIRLSERTICDLELMAVGAFSPLARFMGYRDYQSVLDNMRLSDGHVFPIPVTLPVEPRPEIHIGQELALRDSRNTLLALMVIEEIYQWDLDEVSDKVFGTRDLRHPMVAEMHRWPRLNISGRLRVLQLPSHYDFSETRLTPMQTRARLAEMGHSNVVAFQTRNPLHRVHEELTKRAVEEVDGTLLLHPVVGLTKPGDVDHYTRVRTYRALTERYYEPDRVLLSLLPLAMRLAGPREAVWHMVIRRNYGANHLIVGRDHAGPGNDSEGKPFYGPYDAQDLAIEFSEELGVRPIPFKMLVYLPEEDRYEEVGKVPENAQTASISGTQVREEYLYNGKELPDWFTRPEVAEILADSYPPRHKQGVCIWFTGLSGAGKSTTAAVLTVLLQQHGRQVTLLDGDVMRSHLSQELGFGKEDRNTNVRRMGYVASEIVRHGGVAICAAVSPYRDMRNYVRSMVGKEHYVEVFVDTPLEICEKRDNKGLYERARRGEIQEFTGIDDPYEPPQHPEVRLETIEVSAEENARKIETYLLDRGFLRP